MTNSIKTYPHSNMNGLKIVNRAEKFDRHWLKKASQIEEERYSIACALVAIGRDDSSLDLSEKISEIHNMPNALIFRDWVELTYGNKDRHFVTRETRQLLQWFKSKQVGCRRSLRDIGGDLDVPDHLSDILIDMSIEYREYLENFKAIP